MVCGGGGGGGCGGVRVVLTLNLFVYPMTRAHPVSALAVWAYLLSFFI